MSGATIISAHEEAINKMIEEISMRVFLKATPYASGYRTDLDIEMTPEFFFNHLYNHSKKAEEYISNIWDRMTRDMRKNIILYGYQGCGKTTFVHYMLREFEKRGYRNLLFNFDAYVDKGNEIKHELVAHLYRAIMCDVTGRDGDNDMYPIFGRKCVVLSKFCEVFNSAENRQTISEHYDSWNKYCWLFDKLEYMRILYLSTAEQLQLSQAEYEDKRRTYPENDLKVHISDFNINQLMIVIVLWDIAYSLAFQKEDKCCIVFENLDTIYNASALPDFTEQILHFRNNIDTILANLEYEGTSLAKMHSLHTLFFVMRETTKCEFTDHFIGKVEMYIPTESMSFLYEMKDIINQRNQYLDDLEHNLLLSGKDASKLKKLKQEITVVKDLLEDQYIANKMFNLFNRNFRVGIEMLSEIAFNYPETFSNVVITRHMRPDDWSLYASRCILFRQIYNKFNAEGYFGIMKNGEYYAEINRTDCAVNLSRYILLYLNNRQDITRTEEAKENNMISLDELFTALLSICGDRKLIVDSLWSMYEMRKKQFWGHLVTFDNMLTLNREVLDKQLGWVISGEKEQIYGKVRITTAGFAYLDTLLPHYEYFSARRFKSEGKSLFAYTLKEFLEQGYDKSICMLAYILREVKKEVENCYNKLSLFYKYILSPKEEFSRKNFLNSEFAWRKISNTTGSVVKMYHGERIINSHIGYLDSLRFYCFSLVDDMAETGYINLDVDVTRLLQCVMRIRGFKKSIPTLFRNYNSNVKSVKILSKKMSDDSAGKSVQKVEIVVTNQESLIVDIPLKEIVLFLKGALNYIIVDGIKQYIKLFRIEDSEDGPASIDSIFLVSCYMACIRENIEKNNYFDFTTSICRKTGNRIIRNHLKSKDISHRTQYARQILDESGSIGKC